MIRDTTLVERFTDPTTGLTYRCVETHRDTRTDLPWLPEQLWTIAGHHGHASGNTQADAFATYQRRYGPVEVRHAA